MAFGWREFGEWQESNLAVLHNDSCTLTPQLSNDIVSLLYSKNYQQFTSMDI